MFGHHGDLFFVTLSCCCQFILKKVFVRKQIFSMNKLTLIWFNSCWAWSISERHLISWSFECFKRWWIFANYDWSICFLKRNIVFVLLRYRKRFLCHSLIVISFLNQRFSANNIVWSTFLFHSVGPNLFFPVGYQQLLSKNDF